MCQHMAVASGQVGLVLAGPVFNDHFHACACAGDQLTGVCSAGPGDAATVAATAVCHSLASLNRSSFSTL